MSFVDLRTLTIFILGSRNVTWTSDNAPIPGQVYNSSLPNATLISGSVGGYLLPHVMFLVALLYDSRTKAVN